MKKLFIIFAILCLAAPAMAADWNFYGSARMSTFYTDVDTDVSGVDNTSRTNWALQGNSRIGATVKVNDQIGGGFEYGSGPNLRKLYGTYTFGGGSELLLGQTYTPTSTYFYSNSVFDGDGDLLGVGQFYAGRNPMVQWKTGGFKIALVTPTTVADTANYVVDLIIPKIEASYGFKRDSWFMDVYGGYQTYDLNYVVGNDPTVNAYVVGLGGGMNFGAFYVNLGGHIGRNLGNYGAYAPGFSGTRAINQSINIDANQNEQDNDGWGALGVIGFNLSDMWSFEAGYGYETSELDNDAAGDPSETVQQMYVNATINIAPGFFIVPEVGIAKYDYANTGDLDPQPEVFYAGAKWQINF